MEIIFAKEEFWHKKLQFFGKDADYTVLFRIDYNDKICVPFKVSTTILKLTKINLSPPIVRNSDRLIKKFIMEPNTFENFSDCVIYCEGIANTFETIVEKWLKEDKDADQ